MKLVYSVVNREYPAFATDEDIIQSGMLGLCKAADKWEPDKSTFTTFAWRCIKTHIQDEFRSRAKHNGVLSLEYEVTVGKSPCDTVMLKDTIVGDDDVDYIDPDDGIDFTKLNPKQQEIFRLKKEGKTNREVVDALGVTRQYVSSTLRKIRMMRG